MSMNDSFLAEFFQKILDYRKQEMGEHDVRRYCMFHNPWLISYSAPAFYTAGWVALSQFAPPSTRKYGYKASFFVGALLGVVGVAVQISALKPEAVDIRRRMLIAGRAVEGLGFGLSEPDLARTHWRNYPVGVVLVTAKAGALPTYIVNFIIIITKMKKEKFGWIVPLPIFPGLLLLGSLVSTFILPSTPDNMRETSDVREEEVCSGSLKLLGKKKYRPSVVTAICVPICLQLLGANMIGLIFFQAIGFQQEAALLLEMASSMISSIIPILANNRFTRRELVIYGGTCVVLALAEIGLMEATNVGGWWGDFLRVKCIVSCAAGLGALWSPSGLLISSQIHPPEIRSQMQGISVLVRIIASAVIGGIFPWLLCWLGRCIFFVVFVLQLSAIALAWVFLPETRGISDEQMPDVWGGHRYWKRFITQENDVETAASPSASFSTASTSDTGLFSEIPSSLSDLSLPDGHDHAEDQPRPEDTP